MHDKSILLAVLLGETCHVTSQISRFTAHSVYFRTANTRSQKLKGVFNGVKVSHRVEFEKSCWALSVFNCQFLSLSVFEPDALSDIYQSILDVLQFDMAAPAGGYIALYFRYKSIQSMNLVSCDDQCHRT